MLFEAQRQFNVHRESIQDILPSTPLQEAMFVQSTSGDLTKFAQETCRSRVWSPSPARPLQMYP